MAFPISLSGNTLGKRQEELNVRVRQAAADHVPFSQVIDGAERTDIDRLFKIDLAVRYKNIDYIINTLKCGDSLYITRALKCAWLYDDEFSYIINPEYLQQSLFPHMSTRMQRKLLTAVSMHVRDPTRSEHFYHYCIKLKMTNVAKKFLTFTSVQFKEYFIKNELYNTYKPPLTQGEIAKILVGDDITLAECYLSKTKHVSHALYLLRKFYSIDSERYLNWAEEYNYQLYKTLGLRISKDIMVKFKQRVINNIKLYLKLLNRNTLIRHTTIAEAKNYLIEFLPEDVQAFWTMHYYGAYQFLFNIIPKIEHYHFIKNIFSAKYPGREFEMSDEFLKQEFYPSHWESEERYYYQLMTVEEREAWALRHIEADKETSARDKNYFFYKYVNVEIGLEALKKYVFVTPDATERAKVLHIIIQSARSVSDVEKVLNYYYERFINEANPKKEEFLRKVLEHHNIFEFNDSCWQAFQRLLCNLDVYNTPSNVHKYDDFKQSALAYHIVNQMEITGALKAFLDDGTSWHSIEYYTDKVNSEQKQILYTFLFNLYVQQLEKYENLEYDYYYAEMIEGRLSVIRNLQTYLDIADESLPEIVLIITKSCSKYRENLQIEKPEVKTISQVQLIRMLKENAAQVVEKWPKVKYNIENYYYFKFNTFLKKLRVYFMNDIAKDYLKFFNECLSSKTESRLILIPVYGIFQIADIKYITEFVEKHVPANPKIDHSAIDRHYLYIQEGICRYAGYSRPPLPQSVVRRYITGDYLHYCVPMFNMNMANLRPAECLQFVESLLDSPVSIQKHALRLAFKCFSIEELKSLTKNVWKKSKNISLRMIIFKSVFNEVVRGDDETRDELFQCLLELMSVLNEDDHEDVLQLLSGTSSGHGLWELRDECKPTFIETAWKTLNNFPNKARNAKLKAAIINTIIQNMDIIKISVLRAIADEYFNTMFYKDGIVQLADYENKIGDDFREVIEAKQMLVLRFLKLSKTGTDSIELVKLVMKNCLKSWDQVHKRGNPDRQYFFVRDYCFTFISKLVEQYNDEDWKKPAISQLLECILAELQNSLPMYEIYTEVWKLRLMIVTYALMNEANNFPDSENKTVLFEELVDKFAEQVCAIVTEFVTKKIFCMTLLDDISDELVINMERLRSAIRFEYNSYDIRVVAAMKLIDFGSLETDVLAVKITPDVGLSSVDKWKLLMQKIESIDSFEIKSIWHKRFKLGGYNKL